MNNLYLVLAVYIITINLTGFIFMGYDKRKAKKNRWRVSEKKLYIIALIGGGIGIYIGMKQFRHKTKHFGFNYGIPLIIMCNIAIYYIIITKFLI